MNCILLLLILFFISIILIRIFNVNIFNPIIISIYCYIVGLFFCVIMLPYWKYDLTYKSIVVVSSTFIFMSVCSLCGIIVANKVKLNKYIDKSIEFKEFSYKKKTIMLIIILMFSISIIKNYVDIARAYGYSGNWFNLTEISLFIKNSNLTEGATLKRVNTYMLYCLKGIAYCSIFLFIYNAARLKKNVKSNIYLILFNIPYLFVIYISGWRTDYIFLTVFTLIILGFNLDFNKKDFKSLLKIALVMFVFFIIILVLWMFTAFIRMNEQFNFYKIINYVSTYFGGGIINFDQYLNGKIDIDVSNVFGKRIFSNIYSYLNRLHILNIDIPSQFLANDNLINTNIYSGLFRGYDDFGFIGNNIYLGIIFFIYSFVHSIILKYKNLFFLSILYAFFSYPLCLMGVDEAFSLYIIATTPLYVIFFYGVVYYIMIFKDNKERLLRK